MLRLILYWESLGPTEDPYTVFVHLLDPAGRLISQEDSMPMSNLYPTTAWRPGEHIADGIYELQIPEDALVGSYTLEFGLYHLQTGRRLDVLDEMGNPRDTRLLIPHIRVDAP